MKINLSEISVSFEAENKSEEVYLASLYKEIEELGHPTYRFHTEDGERGWGIYLANTAKNKK